MRVVTATDLSAFAELALPYLRADPVRNNVAYGVVRNRHDGLLPAEPDALWLAVQDRDGELVGVALMTPPHALLLTDMPLTAVDALAEHLAAAPVRLPGVNGPLAVARRLAGRYAELVGVAAAPVMSLRMFRLDQVSRPPEVPGRLREAAEPDRSLLVDWMVAFGAEALPHEAPDPKASARQIDIRLGRPGLLWLWEVGGEPVSTAYLTTPVAGVVRVSGVYTPPAQRRRGYASACVAGISQHALDSGALACMLYTDLANPTSNKIYQAVGYRPVGDTQEWAFRP